MAEFDKATFLRKEWNTGGPSKPDDQFFANQQLIDLNTLKKILSTMSPVTR